MSNGIIGKKLGMAQVFAEDGAAVGVTAIEVEPSVVLQVKTKEKDGYDAIQIGYGRIKQKNVTKPLQGHFNKANKGFFRFVKEFPMRNLKNTRWDRKLPLIYSRLAIMLILSERRRGKDFRVLLKDMALAAAGQHTGPCSIGHQVPLAPVRIHRVFLKELNCLVKWAMLVKLFRI